MFSFKNKLKDEKIFILKVYRYLENGDLTRQNKKHEIRSDALCRVNSRAHWALYWWELALFAQTRETFLAMLFYS